MPSETDGMIRFTMGTETYRVEYYDPDLETENTVKTPKWVLVMAKEITEAAAEVVGAIPAKLKKKQISMIDDMGVHFKEEGSKEEKVESVPSFSEFRRCAVTKAKRAWDEQQELAAMTSKEKGVIAGALQALESSKPETENRPPTPPHAPREEPITYDFSPPPSPRAQKVASPGTLSAEKKGINADWPFPTDHLPVGIKVNVGNEWVTVYSLNVLNSNFMNLITGRKDPNSGKEVGGGQGLNGSCITETNKYEEGRTTTKREGLVADIVLQLMSQKESSLIQLMLQEEGSLIALQECSPKFIWLLKRMVLNPPKGRALKWELIAQEPAPENQEVILYNTTRLAHTPIEPTNPYSNQTSRRCEHGLFTVLDEKGQETQQQFLCTNCHVPGDPETLEQSLKDLAEDTKTLFDKYPGLPFVTIGDWNAGHEKVKSAFDEKIPTVKGIVSYPEYSTGWTTTKTPCTIDLSVVYGAEVKQLPLPQVKGAKEALEMMTKSAQKTTGAASMEAVD